MAWLESPNGLGAEAYWAGFWRPVNTQNCVCSCEPIRQRKCCPDRNFVVFYEIKLMAYACIALCSSRNAVSFSSARTTKRFPSSRWASAIQIVRPSESTADTQPQLQPAFLRLSAMISQYRQPDSQLYLSLRTVCGSGLLNSS